METDLVTRIVDVGIAGVVLVFYIFRLEARHKDLQERYSTLLYRYIRDVRAIAKLPADEFADDLSAHSDMGRDIDGR